MLDEQYVCVIVRNGCRKRKRLLLRPFGDAYDMDAGISYEVRAKGPLGGKLTVEHDDDGPVICGWPGCAISVHSMRLPGMPPPPEFAQPADPTLAPIISIRPELRLSRDDDDTL
jgi:hypothetical protein